MKTMVYIVCKSVEYSLIILYTIDDKSNFVFKFEVIKYFPV